MTTLTKIDVTCPRCAGQGTLPQYAHVNKGICYKCDGTGVLQVTKREDHDPRSDKLLPGLDYYAEHGYEPMSEALNFAKKSKWEARQIRGAQMETMKQFILGNPTYQAAVAHMESLEREHGDDLSPLYTLKMLTRTKASNNLGCVESLFLSPQAFGKELPNMDRAGVLPRAHLRKDMMMSFRDDVGLVDKEFDSGYDLDNTFLHEAIHYIDGVVHNARLLGMPDDALDSFARLQDRKRRILVDYVDSALDVSQNDVRSRLYEEEMVRMYISLQRMSTFQQLLKRAVKADAEDVRDQYIERMDQYTMNIMGDDKNGVRNNYYFHMVNLMRDGKDERALRTMENLMEGMMDHAYSLDPSAKGKKGRKLAQHFVHYAMLHSLVAGADGTAMDPMDGLKNMSRLDMKDAREMAELHTYASQHFREMRNDGQYLESQQTEVAEAYDALLEAGDEKGAEEFLRLYRKMRRMDPIPEGGDYLLEMYDLRLLVSSPAFKRATGWGDTDVDRFMVMSTFDQFIPSQRNDMYGLTNTNEFNADLGSYLMGSTSPNTKYQSTAVDFLADAFRDYYNWDPVKSRRRQEAAEPMTLEQVMEEKRKKEEKSRAQQKSVALQFQALLEDMTQADGLFPEGQRREVEYIAREFLDGELRKTGKDDYADVVGPGPMSAYRRKLRLSYALELHRQALQDIEAAREMNDPDMLRDAQQELLLIAMNAVDVVDNHPVRLDDYLKELASGMDRIERENPRLGIRYAVGPTLVERGYMEEEEEY